MASNLGVVTLPVFATLLKSFLIKSTIIKFSALSFSRKSSLAEVPLIGDEIATPSLSEINRSGDADATWISPRLKYAANSAGFCFKIFSARGSKDRFELFSALRTRQALT